MSLLSRLRGLGRPLAPVIPLTAPCPLCTPGRACGLPVVATCLGCYGSGRVSPATLRWLKAHLTHGEGPARGVP